MNNFKITFNIEMAEEVTSAFVAHLVSQIENVAYSELGKMGDFNMTTSFGSIGANGRKVSISEPTPDRPVVPNVSNIGPVPPVEPERKKRRHRRTKKEILEGRK